MNTNRFVPHIFFVAKSREFHSACLTNAHSKNLLEDIPNSAYYQPPKKVSYDKKSAAENQTSLPFFYES